MRTFDEKFDSARPYTACFVLLEQDRKIAMVLRKNTGWMDGYYGLPAGKVEYGENFTEAAVREALEEAGVTIKEGDLTFVHAAHRHNEYEGDTTYTDWIDIYFKAEAWEGEPHNAEAEKSERLDWIELTSLPENIVPPVRAALEEIRKGNLYSNYGWN